MVRDEPVQMLIIGIESPSRQCYCVCDRLPMGKDKMWKKPFCLDPFKPLTEANKKKKNTGGKLFTQQLFNIGCNAVRIFFCVPKLLQLKKTANTHILIHLEEQQWWWCLETMIVYILQCLFDSHCYCYCTFYVYIVWPKNLYLITQNALIYRNLTVNLFPVTLTYI